MADEEVDIPDDEVPADSDDDYDDDCEDDEEDEEEDDVELE